MESQQSYHASDAKPRRRPKPDQTTSLQDQFDLGKSNLKKAPRSLKRPQPRKRPRPTSRTEQADCSKDQSSQEKHSVTLTPHTHRLLKLIQHGTQSHANYAATLLGQISARSSCLVLWDILGRVQHFLLHPSSSWETRQNAASAMLNVARNIPIPDQIRFLTEMGKDESSVVTKDKQQGLWLSIADLQSYETEKGSLVDPIDVMMQHGRLLLSTIGTSFDVDPNEYEKENNILQSLDETSLRSQHSKTNTIQKSQASFLKNRIRLQRSILMKRLGLGVLYDHADEKNVQDFISNDDFIIRKDQNKRSSVSSTTTSGQSISIRQQNIDRIRKKRKHDSMEIKSTDIDDGAASTIRALLVLEMRNTSLRDNENQSATSSQASSHRNPQTLLATDFIYHMFDPDWKRRHGAFLGTISLLRAWNFHKTHKAFHEKESSSFEFGRWPNDILCRCLCVLSLDQFCDYAGGTIFTDQKSKTKKTNNMISAGMVAPVRESASQLLSIVMSAAPENIWNSCWKVLVKMARCQKHWEVRHGACLAMKYIAALFMSETSSYPKDCSNSIEVIQNEMVNTVANALTDSSDDVRAVAAQVVLSLLKGHSMQQKCSQEDHNSKQHQRCSGIIKKCCGSLWNAIMSVHSLSVCAIDLLTLFSHIVETDCETVVESIGFHMKKSSELCSSIRTIEVTEQILKKIVQFLDFNSTILQLSSLHTLSSICKAMTTGMSLSEEEFRRVLALLYALLRKYFELIFDSSVAEEAQSEIYHEEISQTKTMKKLIEARSTSWSIAVDSMFALFTNICNESSTVVQKYIGSMYNLFINLVLRNVGILQKKYENDKSNQVSLEERSRLCRVVINEDKMFFCQVLASRSLAYLGSKLTRFLADYDLSYHGYSNKFMDGMIQALLYSPWMHMTEGGCLLLMSLSEIIERDNFLKQTNFSYSQETLLDMNDTVPTCIIANANVKFLAVKDSPTISVPYDLSLSKFLEQTSPKKTLEYAANTTVIQMIEEWKDMFISIESNDLYNKNIDIRRYPLSKNSMRIGATVAGAIILNNCQPLPPKLTPMIRHLMNSLKNEKMRSRQRQTCHYIVSLISRLNHLIESPERDTSKLLRVRDKIIDNICNLCCSEQQILEIVKDKNISVVDSPAIQVIQVVMIRFQNKEMRSVAPFWNRVALLISGDAEKVEQVKLNECLQMLCILSKYIPGKSISFTTAIRDFLPTLTDLACCNPSSLVRKQAVSVSTYFCKGNSIEGLKMLLPPLFESLGDFKNESRRFGGCLLLQSIIENIGVEICPYVRDLLPVSMSMMIDKVEECAHVAAANFASLVRVAPLVSNSSSSTSHFTTRNIENDDMSSKVIDHLIHGKPIPFHPLPQSLQDALKKSDTTLRNYQRDGVSWIRFLQSVNLNGALCDDMGLGKTLQTLVGIGLAHSQRKGTGSSNGHSKNDRAKSLVVCPSTLCGHWKNEINKFFLNSNFYQVLRHDGNKRKRQAAWDLEINSANIVVTSYAVLRQDIETISSVMWTYCILDEGHLLKNPKTATAKATRKISARHKLILTGTPVQNRVNELWAIFDFLMPNFLGNEKTFLMNFARPISKGQAPGATANEIGLSIEKLKILHQQVLPFILRREKTHVLKELPPKNITDIPCSMSEEQIRLYKSICSGQDIEAHLETLYEQLIENKTNVKIGKDTLKKILYMRLLCTHPLLVASKSHSDLELDPKYSRLDCSGKLSVLNDLMRHAGIYSDELAAADNDHSSVYIKDDDYENKNIEHDLGSYLEQQSNIAAPVTESISKNKCLIFAQFKQSLDIVEKMLFQPYMPSLRYLRLDGTVPTKDRTKLVKEFHEDESIKVMLLSTKVGSLGLNLTCADTVIFLEMDWNPQVDLQAMDRAHRIGQKKVVNVYRLVSSGTIEEQILKLQHIKLKMAESIVNSENSTMYSMGTDRILDIFTTSSEVSQSEINQKAQENIFDSLNDIWTEDEYSELLSVDGFLSMFG